MFVIISFMLLGILIGRVFRKKVSSYIPYVITALIWTLLFLLGTEVGVNKQLISNLSTLGIEALVITLGAIIGSILFSWLLWRYVRKEGVR